MRVSLFSLRKSEIKFKEYSNFPPVVRDLSVVLDKDIPEEKIESIIFSSGAEKFLKKLKLYDIYSIGENGKVSYTYTLEFRADDRTLTNDEVNKYQEIIVENLRKNLKAELRK